MPKLMNCSDTTVLQTVSNFGFTAQRPDDKNLGASEYTIVNMLVDVSGSVQPFKAQLEKAYKEIIEACKKNPRSENLLVRGATFNTNINELHGFVTLDNIDPSKISFHPSGGTALYDAALEGIETVVTYGTQLGSLDYQVNGLIILATDGEENSSSIGTLSKIKTALESARKSEKLESIKMILIGIGDDITVKTYLDGFTNTVGLDQYVHIDNTDAKGLAKLADFVSRSISSSSQSLGTGGPSRNLVV